MHRYQDSAERRDLTEATGGWTTTTDYDDTDQWRTDVARILLACREAELELEILKTTLSWEKDGSTVTGAVTAAGHTIYQLVLGIVRLLKSLDVLVIEHRDDIKLELQQTPYCTIFEVETSERREAVRSAVQNLHQLNQIAPDTYDQMIDRPSKYASEKQRKTYATLLEAVNDLFSGNERTFSRMYSRMNAYNHVSRATLYLNQNFPLASRASGF